MLEPFLKEGKDILHLGFSSGLSGTLKQHEDCRGRNSLKNTRRQRIIIIDTLCACLGEGLLLYKALQLKEKGKDESMRSRQWVEENKLHICP